MPLEILKQVPKDVFPYTQTNSLCKIYTVTQRVTLKTFLLLLIYQYEECMRMLYYAKVSNRKVPKIGYPSISRE